MCPVLSPPMTRGILYQSSNQPQSLLPALGVLPVENNTHNVVHFAHANDEGADEVEAGLGAAALGDLVLEGAVGAADFGDGREEEVGAVGEPIDPGVLLAGWGYKPHSKMVLGAVISVQSRGEIRALV